MTYAHHRRRLYPLSRPEPMALTTGQRLCLDFVRYYVAQNGVAPSFDEIARKLKVRSRSTVFRMVCALEERGHVVRLKGQARSLTIVEPVGRIMLDLPPDLDAEVRLLALRGRAAPEEVAIEAIRDGLRLHRSAVLQQAATKVAKNSVFG
jgi:SOS-response transcriptional repressor LexA